MWLTSSLSAALLLASTAWAAIERDEDGAVKSIGVRLYAHTTSE